MATFALRRIINSISRSCNSPTCPKILASNKISPKIPHRFYPLISPYLTTSSSSLPLLMYPPLRDNTVSRFYSPVDGKFVELSQSVPQKLVGLKPTAIGPCSRTSVAYISSHDSSLFVYNPFHQSLVFLPSFETLTNQQLTKPNLIKKLIFTWDMPELKAEERICLAIYGNKNEVAFCRQGDTKWTALKVLHGYRYDDFVHYKDQIYYALVWTASRNLIERWDLSGCSSSSSSDSPCNFLKRTELKAESLSSEYLSAQESLLKMRCAAKRYLVKIEEQILLIVRYFCREEHITHLFTVYWLDLVNNDLKMLDGIGSDCALFVGANRSAFCLQNSSYPELKKNSIYFSNDKIKQTQNIETFFDTRSDESKNSENIFTKDCYDFGIFNFDDKTINYCYYPLGSSKTHPPPVWVVSS